MIFLATTMPPIFAMGMDLEIQLAKNVVLVEIYYDILQDFCNELESELSCNYLIQEEQNIQSILGYNFVFINYEQFKEQWIESKQCGDAIKQWQELRSAWELEKV